METPAMEIPDTEGVQVTGMPDMGRAKAAGMAALEVLAVSEALADSEVSAVLAAIPVMRKTGI